MLKIAFHPTFELKLPPKHRFPMAKYGLLPQQLLYEGTVEEEHFFQPETPDHEAFLRIHQSDYYFDFINLSLDQKAERKIGFPLTEDLVKRERLIADGTMKASEYALDNGIGMTISGGTHHAFTDHGEGFCMLNDQAIAARHLQDIKGIKKILIIDLDVHQGNGTAEIFQEDDSVFTFSMHGKNNYPFKKESSDLDIELEDHTGDEHYLKTLRETLPLLLEKTKPDFIFYQSGVDILATDKLGRLNCSIAGCKARDRFVLKTIAKRGIPLEISMGGGYSSEIKHIVEAHANTFRIAEEIFG